MIIIINVIIVYHHLPGHAMTLANVSIEVAHASAAVATHRAAKGLLSCVHPVTCKITLGCTTEFVNIVVESTFGSKYKMNEYK